MKGSTGQPQVLPRFVRRTTSFNAIRRADGTTTGHLFYRQVADAPGNVTQHGVVTCINASLGSGVIVIAAYGTNRIADADPELGVFGLPPYTMPDDDGMVFAVRDNGEGSGATGMDQFTAVLHTSIPVANAIRGNPAGFGFSAGLIGILMNAAETGNIQVRP